ncbi:MAG: hypothetical protein ACR2RE_06770 [Geminicoccaceae bacterium]
MRYLTTPMAFICILFLAACPSNIAGYDDLDLTLPPAEAARKDVFDAGALYEPVQVVLEQAVTEPSISDGLKSKIQLVDQEATAALNDYRAGIASGADDVSARLATFIAVLGRAQALLLDVQTEGLI